MAQNPSAQPISTWPKSLQPLLGYADLYWVADDQGLLQVNGLPIWKTKGNIARMRQTVMLGASDVLTFRIFDQQKGALGSLEFAMLRVGEPTVLSKEVGNTADPGADFAINPSMSGTQKFLIPSSKTGIMRLLLPGLPKENLSWPPTRPEVAFFKWVAPPASDFTAAEGYDSPDLNLLRTLYGNRCRSLRNDFEALMTQKRAKYVEALRSLPKPVPAVKEEIAYFTQDKHSRWYFTGLNDRNSPDYVSRKSMVELRSKFENQLDREETAMRNRILQEGRGYFAALRTGLANAAEAGKTAWQTELDLLQKDRASQEAFGGYPGRFCHVKTKTWEGDFQFENTLWCRSLGDDMRMGWRMYGASEPLLVLYRPNWVSVLRRAADGSFHAVDDNEVVTFPETTPAKQSVPLKEMLDATSEVPIKRNISSLQGLLVSELANGKLAGSATRLSAVALPGKAGEPATIAYNQTVGEVMERALEETVKHVQMSANGWPRGKRIEISFADKYSPKDGPSASVAVGLLLDSLITGDELADDFAVTGDMNADGSVQPIGGLIAKASGAKRAGLKIVILPHANRILLQDHALAAGTSVLTGMNFFSVRSFSEAKLIAVKSRPPDVQRAISLFSEIQSGLPADAAKLSEYMRAPETIKKLQATLEVAPNHVSARLLLDIVEGKGPRLMSLNGSIESMDNCASQLMGAIRRKAQGLPSKEELQASLTEIRALMPLLAPRMKPVAEAILEFGKNVQVAFAVTGSVGSSILQNIKHSAQRVEDLYDKLMADPAIVEELQRRD